MGEMPESATMQTGEYSSGYNSAGMVGTPNANGNSALRLRHPSAGAGAGAPLSSIAAGHRAPPAGAAPPSAPLPPKTYARQQQLQSQWSSESTGSVTLDASSYAGYEQQAGAMGGGMHMPGAAWPHASSGAGPLQSSLGVQVKQEPHMNGDRFSVGPLSAGAGLPRAHQPQAGAHGAKYAPPSQIYQYPPRPLPGAAGFPMAHHPDCNPAYCRCFPTMVSPAQRAIQRSDSQASASSTTGTPPQSAGLNAPPSGFHFGSNEQTGPGAAAAAPPLAQFNPANSDAPQQQQQQQQQLMAAQMAFLSQIPLYLRGFQNQHGVPVTSQNPNQLTFNEQAGLQSAASAGSRRESEIKPGDLHMDFDADAKTDASLNAFPFHPLRAHAADATTRQLQLSSFNPANASTGGAPAGNPFSLALGMPMSSFGVNAVGSMLSEMARLGGQQGPLQLAVTSSPVGSRLAPDTSAAAFSLLSPPVPLDGLSIRGGSSPAVSCSLSSSSASTSNAQLALTPQLAINGQSAAHAGGGGGGELSILAAANSGAQSVLQQILSTEPDPAIINKFLTTEILLNDVLMHVPLEGAHDDSPEYRTRLVGELCRILEQLLYDSVEWARQSVFFKELCVRGAASRPQASIIHRP